MIPAYGVARDDHRFALIAAAEAVEPPSVALCDYAPNVSHPTSEAKKNPGRMMLRGLSVRISCHPDISALRTIVLLLSRQPLPRRIVRSTSNSGAPSSLT